MKKEVLNRQIFSDFEWQLRNSETVIPPVIPTSQFLKHFLKRTSAFIEGLRSNDTHVV